VTSRKFWWKVILKLWWLTGTVIYETTLPKLVVKIRKLIAHNWRIQVKHIWYEAKRRAGKLSSLSLSNISFDTLVLNELDHALSSFLFHDLSGSSLSRNIVLSS